MFLLCFALTADSIPLVHFIQIGDDFFVYPFTIQLRSPAVGVSVAFRRLYASRLMAVGCPEFANEVEFDTTCPRL